jgi:uncharacterized damage-inducible protein DinB
MRGEATTFPDTYATLETGLLLEAYQRGPERVRRALNGLTDEALRAHPIPGKWSVLEIAMHVADSELIGVTRMRLVLGGDGPLLPLYDQDRWSRDLGYEAADRTRLERTLDLFTALRATTVPLLVGASSTDWTRTGVHPDYGPVTLRNLLELYADHAERHVAQILHRRQLLDVTIDLPLLLTERLY